jgi:hypothetical protein
VEVLGFILASSIEGYCVYALALYLFRYNLKKYFWQALVAIEITNIQNFILRDLSLSNLAIAINITILLLFLVTIVRAPLLWSLFMALIAYLVYFLIVNFLVAVTGDLLIPASDTDEFSGYIGQSLTGLIGIPIGWFLYRKGLGFSFSFDKITLKWERPIIISLITASVISLAFMMTYRHIWTNLFVVLIALLIYLVISLKKEVKDS